MRNNHVTPAFRPPVRILDKGKGGMMRKWLLVCRKSERRLARRYWTISIK